jgi:hypothetical protein
MFNFIQRSFYLTKSDEYAEISIQSQPTSVRLFHQKSQGAKEPDPVSIQKGITTDKAHTSTLLAMNITNFQKSRTRKLRSLLGMMLMLFTFGLTAQNHTIS